MPAVYALNDLLVKYSENQKKLQCAALFADQGQALQADRMGALLTVIKKGMGRIVLLYIVTHSRPF